MRVAMGLALNEIDREARAIEFYHVLSSFDFMSSTPTLFNSGTRRSHGALLALQFRRNIKWLFHFVLLLKKFGSFIFHYSYCLHGAWIGDARDKIRDDKERVCIIDLHREICS